MVGKENPIKYYRDAYKDLLKATENEAFSHILSLNLDGAKKEQVIVKDMQRHPAKPKILHVDFQRVK